MIFYFILIWLVCLILYWYCKEKLCTVNGLNPVLTCNSVVWSFGWEKSWEGLLSVVVTDVPTTWGKPLRQLTTDSSLQETDTYRQIAGRVILQPDITQSHNYQDSNTTSAIGLLTWNRLLSTGVNHHRHHTNDSFTTLTLQTNRTERPNFTNGSRTPLESYSQ